MKIRKARKVIVANHVLLFDEPVELIPGQIDYLMHAGFEYNEDGTELCLIDTKIKIKFVILKIYEEDEESLCQNQ